MACDCGCECCGVEESFEPFIGPMTQHEAEQAERMRPLTEFYLRALAASVLDFRDLPAAPPPTTAHFVRYERMAP